MKLLKPFFSIYIDETNPIQFDYSKSKLSLIIALLLSIFSSSLLLQSPKWGVPKTICTSQIQDLNEPLGLDSDSLDNLIKSLDSRKYAERQAAIERLINIGQPALGPLANSVLSGSPETAWRAKQTIELIATNGDEATFFQAVSILQLLFHQNNESLDVKIGQLEAQWKHEQKRNILRKLEQKGAGVFEQANEIDPFGRINPGIPQMMFIEPAINQEPLSASKLESLANSDKSTSDRETTEPKNPAQVAKEIDEILVASLEENRNRIFQHRKALSRSLQENAAAIQQRLGQRQIDPGDIELFIQMELQARARMDSSSFDLSNVPIRIVLDRQWKGSVEELEDLKRIDQPLSIQIMDVDLAELQLRTIGQLPSLVLLEIAGNALPSDKLELIDQANSLVGLRFVDREVIRLPFEKLGTNRNLTSVSFVRCQLSPEATQRLDVFKNLVSIQFFEMALEEDIFTGLEKLPNLRVVEMQVCKFPKSAYLSFRQNAPRVAINFTPQAFLGVRGPMRFTDELDRVEISQVVPGSAAEQGGMLTGDIVLSIDGVPVQRFEDLRLEVAQYQPGDNLKVVVARGSQKKELIIELKPYDSSLE